MKKNKLIIVLFIVAAIVLVMYVCSGAEDGSEDAVLNGQWKCLSSDARVYLTFYDDGTGEEEYDNKRGVYATTKFTWSMVDGRLELSTDDTKHDIRFYPGTEEVPDETAEDYSLLFNRIRDWSDEFFNDLPPVGEAKNDMVDFSHDGDFMKMYNSNSNYNTEQEFIRVDSSLYHDWQEGKWSYDDEDSYEDEDE